MVGEAYAPTALVDTVNVALVAFAATVTFAGTCAAAVLLLLNATIVPPEGAGALNTTVPVAAVPPTTLFGLTVTDDTPGGFTVSTDVCVEAP